MKYVIGYKLFESKEDILDNCSDILIDIKDIHIPMNIKGESVYGKEDITIEIGDDDDNQFRKRYWNFTKYNSEFSRLNDYLDSEGYYLRDGLIYYGLLFDRGRWSREASSFRDISDFLSLLSSRETSFFDLIYSKKK